MNAHEPNFVEHYNLYSLLGSGFRLKEGKFKIITHSIESNNHILYFKYKR